MFTPISLPSNPEPQSAEPYFVDMGGWQSPEFGGGDAVRVDRMGDRFGLAVSMPPMFFDDPARGIHAREWISRLNRGSSLGVRLKFPQPNFVAPFLDCAVGVAAAQASSLPVTGAMAGAVVREGTFATLVQLATGRRFLHQVSADVVIDGGGAAALPVWPRLRIATVAGDRLNLNPVSIDGMLAGNRRSWSLEMTRTVGLQFEIVEVG